MIKLLMLVLLSWPFGQESDSAVHETYSKPLTPVPKETIDHVIDSYFEKAITFAAGGDVLIHDHLYEDVATESGYDFISRVDEVAPYLKQQDLVFLNQETPIGGEALRLSGYPSFNAPLETANLLNYLGADIVSFANNHTLDRSTIGVEKTVDILKEKDIEYVGANISAEDASRQRIMDVDGIKIGFLAYTYGTNGIPVPQGEEYLVNFIDLDVILSDMSAMRDAVDVLVVSMHQGVEYAPYPREDHVIQFEQIAEAGADIILGHHPHVLQPIDIYERQDGGETIIAYSLANFFSAQQDLDTKLGGILEFDITQRLNGGETTIQGVRFMPTYVHSNEYSDFELVPLADAEKFGLENAADVYQEVSQHMQSYTDTLEIVDYLD
ncbi:CapA family protein [Salinicoccus sesuvii]|uniref:CapA family protein n=1 Tax=Salinicoccus sesuvii TaxID=868281 RepID=A0ABV7N931_9STAP